MFSAISPILWTAFIAFVLLALAVDLGVFHRQARTISVREATAWSVICVVLAVIASVLSVAVIASLIAEGRERQTHRKLSDKETIHATQNTASEMREHRSPPRV